MFGLFKKRNSYPPEQDLAVLTRAACRDIKEKWIYFNNTIHYKTEVPLAERIDAFAQPVSQFYRDKYPQLFVGGPQIFWIITCAAITEASTHPPDIVSAAVPQARAKYSQLA